LWAFRYQKRNSLADQTRQKKKERKKEEEEEERKHFTDVAII